MLDRLAKTIKDVDPTLLDAYGSLWDDDVQDSEQHSEMLRLIGFQSFPHTAEDFLKEYITKRTGGGWMTSRKQNSTSTGRPLRRPLRG